MRQTYKSAICQKQDAVGTGTVKKDVARQASLTFWVTGLEGPSSILTRARSQAMFRSIPAGKRRWIMSLGESVRVISFRSATVTNDKLIQTYATWWLLMSKTVTHLCSRWAWRWIAVSCSCLKGCPSHHLCILKCQHWISLEKYSMCVWCIFGIMYVWVCDLSLWGSPWSQQVTRPGSANDELSSR